MPGPEELSRVIDVSGVGTLFDIAREMSKEVRIQRQLHPQNLVSVALPMVTVCIDGTPCIALVDTGCMQSQVC